MIIGSYTGLFFIGLFVGAFGTLIGAGGGFILVPVLLLLYPNTNPEILTSISLAVACLNAISGSMSYARMKRIDYKSALLFSAATLPGAISGAYITGYIPRHTFNIVLAILLIVVAVFLLLRPNEGAFVTHKGAKGVTRIITDKNGQTYTYTFQPWKGVLFSFFVGFLSSMLGIGGGIIHVPVLTSVLGFPIHIATATSHLILALMALASTIVHIIQGNFQKGWQVTALIGAGVVVGAPVGAYFSRRIQAKWIIRALAIALMLVSIRLLMT
jgi:uncharacterized membrane protein YfcA